MAEYAGFSHLREEIFQAETGSLFVWISPPGTAEEDADSGYSFTFIGQIYPTANPYERRVFVLDFMNDLSLKEHAKVLQQLGQPVEPESLDSNGLLRLPVLIPRNGAFSSPEDLIYLIFQVLQETRGSATIFGKTITQPEIRHGLKGQGLEEIRPEASVLASKALQLIKIGAPEQALDNLLKEAIIKGKGNRWVPRGSFILIKGSCGTIRFQNEEEESRGEGRPESRKDYIKCPKCRRWIKKGVDFCPYCLCSNPHTCHPPTTGKPTLPLRSLIPHHPKTALQTILPTPSR